MAAGLRGHLRASGAQHAALETRLRHCYSASVNIGVCLSILADCVEQEDPMSRHTGIFAASVVAGAVCLLGGSSISAMAQSASPPDFAPNPTAGWFAYTRTFIPPASGPGPVRPDPAHPHVSNDDFRATGAQPTIAVGLPDNPILQPWAQEAIRKRNEIVLSGKQIFSPHASCWPVGVPAFLLSPMTRPLHFVQGPKEVVII
jgi:hypothetical protein